MAAKAAAPDVPDAQLIARCLVGDDRHAFAELVKRHQSAVRACLRKLTAGNHALADDLAQETFVLAWRNLKSFRQEARFSTWLYRIATNGWLGQARKRQEELLGDRDDDIADNDADAADSPHSWEADHAAGTTMRLDLERALAQLSDAERAPIVQCYPAARQGQAQARACCMGSGAAGVDDAMNTVNPSASGATEPSADWMDRLLRFDAAEHSDDYIDDAGFTARVMHELPVADALPAW